MLKKDPQERISASNAQNHDWFKSNNTTELTELYDPRETLSKYKLK